MGTISYLARDDNRTLFEMGKAYGFAAALGEYDRREDEPRIVAPTDRERLIPLLTKQYVRPTWSFTPEQISDMADRIIAFADGRPLILTDEHDYRRVDCDEPYAEAGMFYPPELLGSMHPASP